MELNELYQSKPIITGSPARTLNNIDWQHSLINLLIYMGTCGLSWISDQLKLTDFGEGGLLASMIIAFFLDILRRRMADNSSIIYKSKS